MFVRRISGVIGIFLIIFSFSFVPPVVVSQIYQDHQTFYFVVAFLLASGFGCLLWFPSKNAMSQIKFRDSFLLVTAIWLFVGLIGAIPFIEILGLSLTDAVFETLSGLTTAGSTVIQGLDQLPKSILFYRQQLQWIGGMGIIVLVVAILPLLNVGGMRLFKAETPGPMKDDKMSPRILHTAQYLWGIYIGLTAVCAVSFYFAGMNAFDAICHAMTTVSTGGFSTHDASIGFFDSVSIELIASFFMILGGINFAHHFVMIQSLSFVHYLKDEETRAFFTGIILLIVVIAITLFITDYYHSLSQSFRYATFEVITIITSTGFGSTDFSQWPLFIPALLIFSSFFGGCSGSTAGGIKFVRIKILLNTIFYQARKLIHPRAISKLKYNGRELSFEVASSVRAFFTLYTLTAAVFTLLMIATGLDFTSAFGAVAACLNVLGPGLGKTAGSFVEVSATGKWLMSVAMVTGRLEIYTVLVLLSPEYWREV